MPNTITYQGIEFWQIEINSAEYNDLLGSAYSPKWIAESEGSKLSDPIGVMTTVSQRNDGDGNYYDYKASPLFEVLANPGGEVDAGGYVPNIKRVAEFAKQRGITPEVFAQRMGGFINGNFLYIPVPKDTEWQDWIVGAAFAVAIFSPAIAAVAATGTASGATVASGVVDTTTWATELATAWESAVAQSAVQNAALAAASGDVAAKAALVSALGESGAAAAIADATAILNASSPLIRLPTPQDIGKKFVDTATGRLVSSVIQSGKLDPVGPRPDTVSPWFDPSGSAPGGMILAIAAIAFVAIALKRR